MKIRIALFVLFLFAAAGAAHGQNGCVDSPECPTALLAAVGIAGAAVGRPFRR